MEIIFYLVEPTWCFRCGLSNAQQWKRYFFGLPNETDNQIISIFCILHMTNYIYKQRLFVNNNLVLEEFKRILLFMIKQNKFSLHTKYHHLYENLKKSNIEWSQPEGLFA